MVKARTSRYSRSTRLPLSSPAPPWICTASLMMRLAASVPNSLAKDASLMIDSCPESLSQAAR